MFTTRHSTLPGLFLKGALTALLHVGAWMVPAAAWGQQADSLKAGSIGGKVKDSAYNFMLTSATVAVYRDADSALVQFSLPNNFGEFLVQPLPLETPLHLVITHVGYRPLYKPFRLGSAGRALNLGLLYLHQATGEGEKSLDAVVVKAKTPVRMNGDTLEFNADAFRLDSNATAEDLMRRLPGFTIWGDGDITFNGKKINAVLVDGKPFMGTTDVTIATQNLPKTALDKIQVYQQRDEKNPLDSTLFANIKLKEDKKMGYFGKLGGGAGTNHRYTAGGMLSGFNKKLQVTAVGALNNINKLAGSTEVLMRNSSFKGEGANIEYQSDFTLRGENRPAAAGAKFQYDFIPDPSYQQSRRLNAGYFIGSNAALVNESRLINHFLKDDTVLTQLAVTQNINQYSRQSLSGRHERSSERMSLALYAALNRHDDRNRSEAKSEQEKSGAGRLSSSVSQNESENNNQDLSMGVDYTHREDGYSRHRVPRAFTIGYQFSATDNAGYAKTNTTFSSALNAADNKTFNRLYDQRNVCSTAHTFKVSYPEIRRLLFNKRSVGGIAIGLSASIALNNTHYTDRVLDMDGAAGKYTLNNYLTSQRTALTKNIIPSLDLTKSFFKGLTNRYNKWVSFTVSLRNQYYSMEHQASKAFQNISYGYARFIPNGSITYNNHQYGSYEVRYSMNVSTAVTYPGVQHIAPLIDSANLWYRPVGNPRLKPQYKKEASFDYDFTTRKGKNPFNVILNVGIGQIEDAITDSILYDNAGVRTVYAVNAGGNKYANGGAILRKSVEMKKSTLEADARYYVNVSHNPQYINSLLNSSNSVSQNLTVSLGFRHQDRVTVKVEESWWGYVSKQTGFDNSQFTSSNQYTRLIGTLQFPKNLIWSSHLTYNKSVSNNTDAVYFTIWNASLTGRFLKGNKGEVKFSALDLLRQNKGIVNTSSGNTQVFTTSNVLQQYYLVSLSYYPRKFGK